MWSPRAQSDRMLFSIKWRERLEQTPNLDFYQDMVKEVIVNEGRVAGVKTGLGHEIKAKAVILTNGTFLNGIVHIGEKNFGGGRMAEKAATGITEQLVSLGFQSDRLKTGTPPPLWKNLDYSKMEEQPETMRWLILLPGYRKKKTKKFWITYHQQGHEFKTGFDAARCSRGMTERSRYCPVLKTRSTVAERERHQLFLSLKEEHGGNLCQWFLYLLTEDVQYEVFEYSWIENVKSSDQDMHEYDFFPPTQ